MLRMGEIPAIKVMMMPRDTNPYGVIFGGVILSYIDQAGAIHAREVGETSDEFNAKNAKFVTVAMDKIEFHHPVKVGDTLSLFATTIRIGKSSITVEVKAYTQSDFVTEGTLTFVAVDDDRKSVQVFNFEDE